MKCAMESKTRFMCHEHKKGDEPSICAGYLLLADENHPRTFNDFPFSDEMVS